MRTLYLSALQPILGALALILAIPFHAQAQQGPEEIVVTARKREESLQDVPISISAFSADQLQAMGLNNNDAVANMTVNFNTVQQLGRRLDRPVIRGMAAPETFGEPNASYFIDGAYLSGSISAYTLGPIERVEILRGPQSTQFGRATFSGAVNYVTRKPTNDMEGELTLQVGERDTRTYSAWASGPLIEDKLLFFTSGSYSNYGGEWNNNLKDGAAGNTNLFIDPPQYGDNSSLGGTQTKQVEGKLLWLINDTSELTFKAGYVRGDDDHYAQLAVETSELNCFVPGINIIDTTAPNYETSGGAYCGKIDPDNRKNLLNLPDFYEGMTATQANLPQNVLDSFGKTREDFISTPRTPGSDRKQYNFLLGYEQDINDWTLTSRATFNKSNLDTAYDLDGYLNRALSGQFGFYEEQERKDMSFETRIDSPGENAIRGSLGVYYYHFKEDSANQASPGFTGQGQLTEPLKSKTDNYALFGAIDWDIADKWTAAVEARWSRDKKEVDSPNTCNDPTSGNFGNNGESVGKNSLTPRFTLRYEPTDNAMAYAQVAKGNKPGAFNLGFYREGRDACSAADLFDSGSQPSPYVDEEKQWTYELGTKTTWLENRLTANLAAFYIDWDNQTFFETTTIDGQGGTLFGIPTSIGFNAGKSRIWGLELETSLAITNNLLATFAYGFTDGKFKEGYSCDAAKVTGDGLTLNANGNYVCIEGKDAQLRDNNLKDKTIPNSPRHNFVTSLAYSNQINADLSWFSRTDYSYEDGRYSAANNFAEIGKRQIWNARSGLQTDRWTATLFVNNILDKNTPSAIIGFPRFGDTSASGTILQGYALSPTPGRIWGGEVIVRFGARAQ